MYLLIQEYWFFQRAGKYSMLMMYLLICHSRNAMHAIALKYYYVGLRVGCQGKVINMWILKSIEYIKQPHVSSVTSRYVALTIKLRPAIIPSGPSPWF